MKYYQPVSVKAALDIADPSSIFLAGGTDLILQLRESKVKPRAIIDLGKIQDLKQVVQSDDCLELGSMVTFESLRKSSLVQAKAKALWLSSGTMGSPQIRNQATIGGNLGNNSPAADGLPPLLAMGALVRLASRDGEEILPLAQIVAGSLP
ncbi:MAG TPA: FAD binding domain-containing protein, partial [Candidatus Deferrimicrobium sp.]|nr:FAD binding domain-containing protein [Candidatus Deferrimicrobium sp.]